MARSLNFAHIRVSEPAGERNFDAQVTVGGAGADVVVPGCPAGAQLRFEREDAIWLVFPCAQATVRFDGVPLSEPRDLRVADVLCAGDAQIVIREVTRTLLRLDVRHLVGNDTITPAATITDIVVSAPVPGEEDTSDLEIREAPLGSAPLSNEPRAAARRTHPAWLWGAAAGLIAVLGIFASVETIKLDVEPANARVLLPETLLWFRSRAHLYVFAGKHTVRAEHAGYRGAQTSVVVDHDSEPVARVRLLKLPGVLSIDTKGVQATVFIDGAATGLAPGSVSAPAGTHTLTVRAPRYLDFIQTLAIEGGGRQQRIAVSLVPSWGTLVIAAEPKSARIRIDGAESGIAPASLDLQVGIHHVSLLAPGYRPWESSLVIRPGERLSIGPVRLGAPDAQLNVRSRPAGAEVSVAGSFRGRTPLRVALAPGVQYEVVVSLPGHSSYFESVFAEAGATLSVEATLPGSAANLKISGDPPGAEVFVDGVPRGKAPQSLSLDTVEHRIEVRKEGYVPYAVTLAASPGLERQVNYRLASQERSIALQESAATVTANIGYALRLIPGGSFQMGSERREQGRRPNEGFRRISLRRPFYIGISEVTNAEFRRFRAAHTSGFIDKHSLDLDEQPVVQVSWDDAAEFCNWLSAEDGLPPAYIDRDGKHSLVQPVTRGYRLPTEAEWEYAARYAAADQFRRFSWGDTLPVPGGSGNLAGSEAAASLPATLEGYRDTFAVTAPVRRFQPTPLGLYDFTGNVSEWVNDRYLSFVDSAAATDPLGPQEGSRHVIRGANWQSAAVADLRLAWRDGADAPSRVLGFRVARYAE